MLITGACIGLSLAAFGQRDAAQLLRFGQNDGKILATEYLRPFGEVLGINLNNGWYNSAGIHKLGGFDITVVATGGFIPSGKKYFDVAPLLPKLENFELVTGSKTLSPTLAGKFTDGQSRPEFSYANNPDDLPSIDLPNGSGFNLMLSPAIQGAVGLPLNTEIMARFMPKVSYKDYGKATLWGAGIKHSLWDDLPFLKNIPFVRLSLMGAYTHFSSDINVSSLMTTSDKDNILKIKSDAYTIRVVTGVDLPIVSIYAGVGYGNSASSFAFKGTFEMPEFASDGPSTTAITNPVSINYDHNGLDFNAGLRLKLAFLTLHADYAIAPEKYRAVTAGVGINFR